MIDVNEFLAVHPLPENKLPGDARAQGDASSADAKRTVGTPRSSSRGSDRRRRSALAPTHAVPVSTAYTSGFGGSLSDEDAGWEPQGKSRFRGNSHSRGRRRSRYRSGAPVRRVPDDPNDMDACREAALTLLDAAPRSSMGLVKKLVAKGYGEIVAQDVVSHLVEVRLIDDEDYAQSVIRHCVARQYGLRGTLQELRRKDVDNDTANVQVRLADEQGVFEDAAWELGRKVAAKTQGLDREVRKRRFWSAGGRKGHNPDVLRRVAQELFG